MNFFDKHKSMKSIFTLLFAFFLLTSEMLHTTVNAAYAQLDFHNDSSSNNVVITASEFLAWGGINNLSNVEKRCFDESRITLTYSYPIIDKAISVSSSNDSITVKATIAEYTASNGATVVWIPDTAVLGNTEKKMDIVSPSGTTYSSTFTGLEKDKIYTVNVNYRATITLTANVVNNILSIPYNKGIAAIETEKEYELKVINYQNDMASFKAASAEYAAKFSEYEDYLKAYSEYTALYTEYLDYKQKVENYDKAITAYKEYLLQTENYNKRLEEYNSLAAEYDNKLKAYNDYIAYLANLDAVQSKMNAINSAFSPMNDSVSLYSTIMSSIISEVVSRKEEIVAFGVPAADVDNAGNATNELRNYLAGYSSASTEEAKFNFYKQNYNSIKSSFIKLYNSLSSLKSYSIVQTALDIKKKTAKFNAFISDLGYICDSLSDSANSSPLSFEWPEAVSKAESPKKPVLPIPPKEVKPPIKTWTKTLEEPLKPQEVLEPVKPSKNDFISSDSFPTAPLFTETERDLMDGMKNGSIYKRTVSNDLVLSVWYTASTSVFVSNSNSAADSCTVNFHNGDDICFTAIITKGTKVKYEGKTPTRTSDEQYDYVFDGWVDKNGKVALLSSVVEDTDYYASFKKTLRKYTVTFVSRNKTDKVQYTYGSIPNGTNHYTKQYYENEAVYTFSGWNKVFEPVTADATYIAVYSGEAKEYQITFIVRDEVFRSTKPYGEFPACDSFEKEYEEDGKCYLFYGWSPAVLPVTSDAVYHAQFIEITPHESYSVSHAQSSEVTPHESDPANHAQSSEVTPHESDPANHAQSSEVTPHESDPANHAQLSEVTPPESYSASYDNEYCSISVNTNTVSVGDSIKTAIEKGLGFSVSLGSSGMMVENDALDTMNEVDLISIIKSDNGVYYFTVADKNGDPANVGEVLLSLPYDYETKDVNAYLNGEKCDCILDDKKAYVMVNGTGMIELRDSYLVNVMFDENGETQSSSFSAEAGTIVKIPFLSASENLILSISDAKDASGNNVDVFVDRISFVMPESDVNIELAYRQKNYTIVFMNGNTTISSASYEYGSTVVLPPSPTYDGPAPEDPEKQYVFAGWTPDVTTVIGDTVYNAVFIQENIEKIITPPSRRTLSLPILILLSVIIAAIVLTVVLVHRSRKHHRTIK